MTFRYFFGTAFAIASAISLLLYVATWFGYMPFAGIVSPIFAGNGLILLSSAVTSSVLKPHYKVQRVMQIQKLRAYFVDWEYKSIWLVFGLTFLAITIGIVQAHANSDTLDLIFQVFTAGWFGFLYIDSMILLRAKFPAVQGDYK